MLTRGAILLAWLIAVLAGSSVNALILREGEVFGIGLAISAGASLPYLAVFLVLAPRMAAGPAQGLHFGLAAATLLGLMAFLEGFAFFVVPYYVIGVVVQLLLHARLRAGGEAAVARAVVGKDTADPSAPGSSGPQRS